jgi:hypothetical protein
LFKVPVTLAETYKLFIMPQIQTVEPTVAQRWVDNWRNPTTPQQEAAKNSVLTLKGFWIPGQDLIDVMQESGAANGRSYFAIDDENALHQLYVGVDADGNDMIDADQGWNIYDLTKPCPPMCSSTGPLK